MPKQRKNETKDEHRVRVNAYMKARYEVAVKWLQEYKIAQGCADCGYNEHHAGLEIDHLTPRNGDGNKLIYRMANRGVAVLERELKDCEVVCGTCHNIRTWKRRNASLV